MDVQEVLKIADDIVFAKTGKHLNHLQEGILRGTWQRQKYPEIAKACYRSEAHVKKVASKLWKLLSEILGEDINQSNFRYTVERLQLSIVESNFGNYYAQIDNFCNNNLHPSAIANTEKPNQPLYNQTKPKIHQDLSDAPDPNLFYNRTSELSTLKQWILQAHTRLITVYGLSGIGKSAIALKLIEQIQTQFDYIIWQSLDRTPILSTLQTELKQFFSQSQPTPLTTVIDYFRTSRCLVILDDVQNIFNAGELVSQYLPGYEDYGKMFKQIATSSHQSCLILLSWEKPKDIANLEAENQTNKTLHLQGLGEQSAEILREKGLKDEEKWSELIALYQGHPSWLNIIASTIIELFDGSVSLFLDNTNDLFLGDLEPLLASHIERLSDSEKKAFYWLASQNEAVDISRQPADSGLSKAELWQVIQSLTRRSLVEKVQVEARSMFLINPVFKAYIQSKI
ncbi:response regulator receiver protein [Oscillatoria nigro-viridis PCC 7112]|uniref:Response regulator receiver protein n=1 Tax=Phormidium nigroviride PCC 7112 TaxID=179408 RepID=K9VP40_9CYAN|nr:NB-ARC domain-containing protein [Oscillatoria nigro-viridis]AFZ09696.1 response regulator receiver protein [Oscillatoria nigro-viridis PCC 7112]